jgi:hypothetical protein
VLPKSFNVPLSTSYYNLVAVCKNPVKDLRTKRTHCDKERLNTPIIPIFFYDSCSVSDSTNHPYFIAQLDGKILPKNALSSVVYSQIESLIEILNLNHSSLVFKRLEILNGIIDAERTINDRAALKRFWQVQFNRITVNLRFPYRQFVLMYLSKKLGRV